MRTRLHVTDEAEAQLVALAATDRRAAQVARKYIERLALEPELGQPVERGYLADVKARRIRFGAGDTPEQLFGQGARRVRRGDQDLSEGPPYRVVYITVAIEKLDVKLVIVAAVGRGHTDKDTENAYQAAERVLRNRLKKGA